MEKRFKNGLCLGKFMPIHNGHVHMIREAAKQCEVVHVMVCSRLCEPIDGEIRFKMAKDIFINEKNINVIHCPDENPQYPEDNENFWQIWHDSVYSYIPELDAVFASEDYVFAFAKCLNVEPVLVDKNRVAFPISGTDIRRNPFDNWAYIPDEVKSYFRMKIAIIGPESTGKSTLTTQLGEIYDGMVVDEYGRWYTENKVKTKDLKPEDFYHIAGEHYQSMLRAERICERDRKDCRYIFVDTEAIVTKTFLSMYTDMNDWYNSDKSDDVTYYSDKIDGLIKLQIFGNGFYQNVGKIDLYLLTYPDIAWKDDGTRDFSEQKDRLLHFLRIKAQLEANNANFKIVMGKGDQRLQNAISIIKEKQRELREKPWEKISFER